MVIVVEGTVVGTAAIVVVVAGTAVGTVEIVVVEIVEGTVGIVVETAAIVEGTVVAPLGVAAAVFGQRQRPPSAWQQRRKKGCYHCKSRSPDRSLEKLESRMEE